MSVLMTVICAFAGYAVLERIPLLGAAVLALPVIAAFFCIRGYTLDGSRLLIHRLGWTTSIALTNLIDCEVIPAASFRAIRTFGNGGFFSFSGWYYSKALGHHRAYVTDHNDLVLLRLRNRNIVISPRPREKFMQAMQTILTTQS